MPNRTRERPDGASSSYWSFALQVCLAALAVGAAGWWLAPGSRDAVSVGVLAALIASLIGGLVSRGMLAAGGVTALFGAMAVRLLVAVLLGAVAALSGRFSLAPLLLALAIAHLVLLVPDSLDAMRLARQQTERR
ncbi:MAG: hypothetical protein ACRD2Z_07100 [Thermoanaerobaculia bacterium]